MEEGADMLAEKLSKRLESVEKALQTTSGKVDAAEIDLQDLKSPSRLERLFGPELKETKDHPQWVGDYTIRLSLDRNKDLLTTLRELRSHKLEVDSIREDLGVIFAHGPVAEAEKLGKLWNDCYFRPGHKIWCSAGSCS